MAQTSLVQVETVIETDNGYLSPEFIADREAFWMSVNTAVYGGCSDDREPSATSVATLADLNPNMLRADEGYASIFGGLAGVAKNILVVGAAVQGQAFVKRVGGIAGIMDELVSRSQKDTAKTAVQYVLHSAEGNENPDGTFCMQGGMPTGCAYCGGIGATSALLVHKDEPLIRDIGRADQVAAFGNDNHFENLLNGHRVVLEHGTDGRGAEYIIDRPMYVERVRRDMPVMVLAGKHTAAKQTGVIHNFSLHEVGSASQAAAASKRFYRQDIGVVTADIIRKFPDYNLDAELLMRAFVLDSTPVRAVLAAGDNDPELNGQLEPRNLAVGFRGNAGDAIRALQTAA